MQPLRNVCRSIREYLRLAEAGELARRYFVTNAFDSTLTALGLIIGSLIVGVSECRVVLSTGLSAGLAMGLSGFVGTLITERAERMRKLRELERNMLVNLEHSVLMRAHEVAAAVIALASGVAAPIMMGLTLLPFAVASLGLVSIGAAYIWSIAQSIAVLFALGAMLGRISEENWVLYGFLMAGLGIFIALIGVALQRGAP